MEALERHEMDQYSRTAGRTQLLSSGRSRRTIHAMDTRLSMIFARRSVRQYSDKAVGDADLRALLDAGMAAPSANNRRPWHFVAVRDRAVLLRLAEAHPYGKMLAGAGLGIAVCGDPAIAGSWVVDCAAAAENILVAAAGLGLGGVWLGVHGDAGREAALRKVLGIPEKISVLALLSLGHPAEKKEPRTQYDEARVHRDQW
jgi:nitroreductase